MLYTFINSDNNKKSNMDLPNCTIKTKDKSYVVKDSVIKVFDLNEEGEPVGEGQVARQIALSGKHFSVFSNFANKDNYNTRLDSNDLKNVSKSEFKDDIKDIYGDSKNIRIKKAKVGNYAFNLRVKDKSTKEVDELSYKENRPGFWDRLWQKLKPKKSIKYTTPEFEYKVKKGETIEAVAKKFGVEVEKILDKNQQLLDNPELTAGETLTIPKVKHKTKVLANHIQTIPKHTYVVDDETKLATIANKLGISQYRLLEANPQIKFTDKNGKTQLRALENGEKIKIPEYKVVSELNSASLKGIAEQTGISELYIEDILFGIEGRHSKPDLKPYYDGVENKKSKSKGNNKGVLTIGFGHTGRVFGIEMNSKNKDSIEITEDEAYLILAQDLMLAKQDAQAYFGEDFDNAPLSVQEGIIDIIYNKGIEGVEREGSPSAKLKENLRDKDYVAAASNLIVKTGNRGLMKRNVYRVMTATRDLRSKKRKQVLEQAQGYYEQTLDYLKDRRQIADTLKNHWNDAQQDKVFGYFK